MTMRERIMQGKLFTDECEGLPEERLAAKKRMKAFNSLEPDELEKRISLQNEIFGRETKAWIEPPFYFCYGTHITIGEKDSVYYYKDRKIEQEDLKEERTLRELGNFVIPTERGQRADEYVRELRDDLE